MAGLSAVRGHNDPIRLGVYRHYKHTDQNPKYYLVQGIGRHTVTEEKLVVYVPLYVAGGPRIALRPLQNFLEPVVIDGERIERFTYIGTEVPEYSV